METEVGIAGFECFSPLGTTFAETWQALASNRRLRQDFTRMGEVSFICVQSESV